MSKRQSSAVSLDDVRQSQGLETPSMELTPTFEFHEINQPTEEQKSLEPKTIVYKLVKGSKNKFFLAGEADIRDPKTNKIRRARLLTGVTEVWKDEQKVDESYARLNGRSIEFDNRKALISSADEAACFFLDNHFGNEDVQPKQRTSRWTFFKYDPAKAAQAALQSLKLRMEATQKASSFFLENPAEAKKHAVYLGIRMFDEYGYPKQDDLVMAEYYAKAEADPSLFLKTFQSEQVDAAYYTRKALAEGLIHTKDHGAYWTAGGVFICQLNGEPISTALQNLYLAKTKDSEAFKQALKARVK